MEASRAMTPRTLVLTSAVVAALAAPAAATAAQPTVFAHGLNDPRGLEFGPNGRTLYVAEGGLGGTRSTVGQCRQVPAPVGPYTGGPTARVSAVWRNGTR